MEEEGTIRNGCRQGKTYGVMWPSGIVPERCGDGDRAYGKGGLG